MKIDLGPLIRQDADPPAPQLFELTQWGVRLPNGTEIWSADDRPFVHIPGAGSTTVRLSGAKGNYETSTSIEDAARAIRSSMLKLGNVATEPPFVVIERKVTIILHPKVDSTHQLDRPQAEKV